MIYTKPLPKIGNIMRVAEAVGPFPATQEDISETAQRIGLDSDTLRFLDLFPAGEIFDNRIDFIARCEELGLLIRDERDMPEEGPLSPLD